MMQGTTRFQGLPGRARSRGHTATTGGRSMHLVTRSSAIATVVGASTGLIVLLLTLGPTGVAQGPSGATSLSGSSDGVIMYQRRDSEGFSTKTFTIAPDGTGQVQILTDYRGAVMSLDGRRAMAYMLAADGNSNTTGIVNADGTGYAAMELPTVTINLKGFTWGPGGVVGFAGGNDVDPSQDGIYVGDPTDPASIRQITSTPDGGIDYPLEFSPDGSRVAYLRDDWPNTALLVVGVDGQHEVQLNPSGSEVDAEADVGWQASWSPDGLRVAFTNANSYGFGTTVFVADADGGNLTKIYQAVEGVSLVSWSPDGQRIMFNAGVAGYVQVLLVHPDGSDATTITSLGDSRDCWGAKWSPDGSTVLFQHGTIGNRDGDLWTMDADGTNAVQLTHDPGWYQWYAWAP